MSRTRRRRRIAALAIALLAIQPAHAEVSADGVLSLRTDAWSGDRELTDRTGIATASVWGRGKIDAGGAGQLVGNAWLRAASETQDEPGGRIRELYWRQRFGPVDLRVGRQMIVWGRADGMNPTDNLSPRDFRLLAPEDGDLRHGNELMQVQTETPVGQLSWLWFPNAASHTIPLQAVPGVTYRSEKPDGRQWALRWEWIGSAGLEASVSYMDGLDPTPDLVPGALSASGLEVLLRNQPLRVLGADMSLARDGVVWRAEMAVTRSASEGAADFSHKKPQLWFVGGAEWTLRDSTTFGLQATAMHVRDYGDPDELGAGPLNELYWRQLATSGQSARNQVGVLWRLARRVRNDTLLLETSGAVVQPSGGGSANGLARARADYALDDHWQVLVGGDYYFGPKHSSFGQLGPNSLLYIQLRYGL